MKGDKLSSRKSFTEDIYVRCPFYKKEGGAEVRCTGMCGESTVHYFKSGAAKQEFKEDFCNEFYWNCACYRALEKDIV